jgi:hypothetical protein
MSNIAIPTDKVVNKGLIKITKITDILVDKFQSAVNDYEAMKDK